MRKDYFYSVFMSIQEAFGFFNLNYDTCIVKNSHGPEGEYCQYTHSRENQNYIYYTVLIR